MRGRLLATLLALYLFAGVAYGASAPRCSPREQYLRELLSAGTGALCLAVFTIIYRSRGRVKRLEAQRNELALVVMLHTRQIRRDKETVIRQKQQIEELLIEAQESNRAKDEFLANISHEIRTPLHGIIGMSDLALHSDVAPTTREYLEIIDFSAKTLLALVNDVLDFAKIEAGGLRLENAEFSLRECVHAATGAFKAAARKKQVEFHVHVDNDVPDLIEGDSLRLRQILLNVTGNAVKFTERGFIRLDVSVDETGDWLRFQVEDTGIGIPKDKFEAIFEPFQQADGSTTRKYGGTGLGLSICTRLAKQMGGELTLESEVGQGSTFTLRLPLHMSSSAMAQENLTGLRRVS